jgi:putative FmdB family regulatory protein
VPTYEYKCEECGNIFEVRHSISDNPSVRCPECNAGSHRIITGGSGFIMKSAGSGGKAIECGRSQTCCGKTSPCETRPCHK